MLRKEKKLAETYSVLIAKFNSARCSFARLEHRAGKRTAMPHHLDRLASGSCEITRTEWSSSEINAAAAERALETLDPKACLSRPTLTAPAEWIRGEGLEFEENLSGIFKEREVRFGPDDADDLPVITMLMLHAVVAFNRIANARTLLAAGADEVRRRSSPLQASVTSR